ncbi:MAG: carboxypeptidase regulatory-like domain-containing protein, partial [Verrucomicrobiota bacterium]
MKSRYLLFNFLISAILPAVTLGQTSGPPLSLGAGPSGSYLLSWPVTVESYVLEVTEDLGDSAAWQLAPHSPSVTGPDNVLILYPETNARFYRLRLDAQAGLPPEPASVAPPLRAETPTPFAEATAFLYTGAAPIQFGVARGAIQAASVCVVRGRVMQRDGSPLSGVTVSVLNHPDLGFTRTRNDGQFDLAMNGGGDVNVDFQRPGYARVQRSVRAPWLDYAHLEDVVMIKLDPTSNVITFGTNAPQQAATASAQTDAAGTRQPRILFPAGTCASVVLPNGQTQDCSGLTIRVTEFTVGPNGPAAMLAALPPSSTYTYCAEFSADEAYALGATLFYFNQPVPIYLENFLNIPVGAAVPAGWYDRQAGNWKAGNDGRVLRSLAVSGGLVELDVTGGGTNASLVELAALGIDAAERQHLASIYPVGQSFWRVPVQHFSSWDFNFCSTAPPRKVDGNSDGVPPANGQPRSRDQQTDNPGGTVDLPDLTFRESIPLVGVPFALHYASDRMPGYTATRELEIAVTGTNVPPGAIRAEAHITVAGRSFDTNFPAIPNQFFRFQWDGKDAYGRTVFGTINADVTLGYVFPTTYLITQQQAGVASSSFARFPDQPSAVSASTGRENFVASFIREWLNNGVDLNSSSLGGWGLSVHHAFDPDLNVVYLGNGRRYTPRNPANGLNLVAGGPNATNTADNLPATQRSLSKVGPIIAAPDGTIYYITGAFANWAQLRRITPDGTDQPVTAYEIQYRDALASGGPARQTRLDDVTGLGLGLDGSIYLAEYGGRPGPPPFFISRIRRITPDGIIHDFAGDAASQFKVGFNGDGKSALQTQFGYLQASGFVVAPDGSVYIADRLNWRVRRIGTDGLVFTVAGTGNPMAIGSAALNAGLGASTNGVPATQVDIGWHIANAAVWGNGLALGPDGSFYFDSYRSICRVAPDGIISFVLGGGPNQNARLNFETTGVAMNFYLTWPVLSMLVDSDNSLYFATGNLPTHIMRIAPDGYLHPFAGRAAIPNFDYTGKGDGGDPRRAVFAWIRSIARHPDGGILIGSDSEDPPGPRNLVGTIRRAGSSLNRQVGLLAGDLLLPSENGSEIYHFDANRRHLATLDSLTFSKRFTFDYDASDRLIAVHDAVGNVTTIRRDVSGNPNAIISPYGQLSVLGLDANGFLATVTNPAG